MQDYAKSRIGISRARERAILALSRLGAFTRGTADEDLHRAHARLVAYIARYITPR